METSLPPASSSVDEAARLAACKIAEQIAEAAGYAKGLYYGLLDLTHPDQITAPARFAVAVKLLRAADHEFGKAVR